MIGQRPNHLSGTAHLRNLLVGQQLVDGRAPQITVGQVARIEIARASLLELVWCRF